MNGDVPDIRVIPTRWAETEDGSILIEWVNTGTLLGSPIQIRGWIGTHFETARPRRASYFDPRPFLEASASTASES